MDQDSRRRAQDWLGSCRTSNSADFEASADLRGQLALGPAEDNVQKLLAVGNHGDVLPLSLHGGGCCEKIWMFGRSRTSQALRLSIIIFGSELLALAHGP